MEVQRDTEKLRGNNKEKELPLPRVRKQKSNKIDGKTKVKNKLNLDAN